MIALHSGRSTLPRTNVIAILVWAVGLTGLALFFWCQHAYALNVVTYRLEQIAAAPVSLSYAVPILVFVTYGGLMAVYWCRRCPAVAPLDRPCAAEIGRAGLPLLLVGAVAVLWWWGGVPANPSPAGTLAMFVSLCAALVAVSWSIAGLSDAVATPTISRTERTSTPDGEPPSIPPPEGETKGKPRIPPSRGGTKGKPCIPPSRGGTEGGDFAEAGGEVNALHASKKRALTGRRAALLLILAIVLTTLWHTFVQLNFWRHFMLGYADFGFFTTEFEHCLPWKEIGPLRFADTRMGYHCIPMFYALVPFYAVIRSPVFLMVVGPLALNAAAMAFFRLARHRGGSPAIGLLAGLAWLALPSLSRLPYANTYGFQSIYLAVPWLAFAFCLAAEGRRRLSHLCLAGAMLCEETVCGVAVGWGVYLMLFTGRKRDGLAIVAVSLVYLFVSTALIIPSFDVSRQYTRLALFGEVSAAALLTRIARPEVWCYLAAALGPMFLGIRRAPRLLVAAAPTLLLIMLLRDSDYLSLKFWHQTTPLVVIFAAATIGVTANSRARRADPGGTGQPIGKVLGLLIGALLFHQLLGFSPLAQSYRPYLAHRPLHEPDSRLALVERLHRDYSPAHYVVLATERMAAHFTDYRTVVPAADADFARSSSPLRRNDTGDAAVPPSFDYGPCLMIVDRSDTWDRVIADGRTDQYLARARAAGMSVVLEEGPVVVLIEDAHSRADLLGKRP